MTFQIIFRIVSLSVLIFRGERHYGGRKTDRKGQVRTDGSIYGISPKRIATVFVCSLSSLQHTHQELFDQQFLLIEKNMHSFKKKSTCILMAAIAAAVSPVIVMANQSDQTVHISPTNQTTAPTTKAQLSPPERTSGTNVKLDDALLRIKQRQSLSTPATSVKNDRPSTNTTQIAPTIQPETYVTVEIVVKDDPATVQTQLEKLGFKTKAVFHSNIAGSLPVSQIDQAAKLSGVLTISKPEARTKSGKINSQGDLVQHSKLVRSTYMVPPQRTGSDPQGQEVPLDGSGLTIGVISDSFNCSPRLKELGYTNADGDININQSTDVASDDLPAGVNIVQEGDCTDPGNHDEGRAMAQIIHDVAPGARIAFYGPSSSADMALGIKTLAMPTNQTDASGRHGAGAQIVVDDLGWSNETPYDAGIVGQGIEEAVNQYGIAYFSSAGNEGQPAYDNNAAIFAAHAVTQAQNATITPLNLGGRLLNFDASGRTTVNNLPINLAAAPDGKIINFSVYWDQSTPRNSGSAGSIQVCIADRNGNPVADDAGFYLNGRNGWSPLGGENLCVTSTVGQPARIKIGSTSNFAYFGRGDNFTLRVSLVSGTAPGRMHIFSNNSNLAITQFGTSTGTIVGHPLSPNALAVGATDYFQTPYCDAALNAATLETFSSSGGTLLLFNADGTLIAHPAIPQKPDFVAPDGASTTFFGGSSRDPGAATTKTLNCRSTPWQFYGTSAAAPHAAAVAALLWQKQSNSWPVTKASDLGNALRNSAADMGLHGFNYNSGFGFIQTDSALPALQKAIDTKRKNGQW